MGYLFPTKRRHPSRRHNCNRQSIPRAYKGKLVKPDLKPADPLVVQAFRQIYESDLLEEENDQDLCRRLARQAWRRLMRHLLTLSPPRD